MMKADPRFGGKVDPRSGRSLILKQSQIRAYFSRQAAVLKRAAIDNALEKGGDSEQESSDESDDGVDISRKLPVGADVAAVALLLLEREATPPPTTIFRA